MTALLTVTITGADDAVDPAALAELSREFRFVEWAVLISAKRTGEPRYPSMKWLRWFFGFVAQVEEMQTALHLCGDIARAAAGGDGADELGAPFGRVQLNGYELGQARLGRGQPSWILQCRFASDFAAYCEEAARLGASVLYDPSGGAGVSSAWPKVLANNGVPFGIAGGIRPDNVADAVAAAHQLGACWIDLESGARDERNLFDLRRVRTLLELVAELRSGAP